MKKLYRSQENKILAGVFGGIGEYSKIDPTVFRLLAVLLLIFTGLVPGIIFYIIAIVIIPKNPKK